MGNEAAFSKEMILSHNLQTGLDLIGWKEVQCRRGDRKKTLLLAPQPPTPVKEESAVVGPEEGFVV